MIALFSKPQKYIMAVGLIEISRIPVLNDNSISGANSASYKMSSNMEEYQFWADLRLKVGESVCSYARGFCHGAKIRLGPGDLASFCRDFNDMPEYLRKDMKEYLDNCNVLDLKISAAGLRIQTPENAMILVAARQDKNCVATLRKGIDSLLEELQREAFADSRIAHHFLELGGIRRLVIGEANYK